MDLDVEQVLVVFSDHKHDVLVLRQLRVVDQLQAFRCVLLVS